MAHLCPKLGEAASVLDPLICRHMTAPSSGWLGDMTCLSSLLADLNRQWGVLELPGRRLHQSCQADIQHLSTELDELESTQRLRVYLARLLSLRDWWLDDC
jgi:hypothetical protein